jgi:hypothetical protein
MEFLNSAKSGKEVRRNTHFASIMGDSEDDFYCP